VPRTATGKQTSNEGLMGKDNTSNLRRKRNTLSMLIIVIAIIIFLWLFWMIGEAGYKQTVPRLAP
jgi:uncharacterized membrane protein (DUF106 family)